MKVLVVAAHPDDGWMLQSTPKALLRGRLI